MPINDEAILALARQVRLLANDPEGEHQLFDDDEVAVFLDLEHMSVKRAAAQMIDTIADNEVLLGKVIRDHQLQTDGAKVADSLRKRAATLREQAGDEEADSEDGFAFEVVDILGGC